MDPLANNSPLLPPLPPSPTPLDLSSDINSQPVPWHNLPDGERSPHILGYDADGNLIPHEPMQPPPLDLTNSPAPPNPLDLNTQPIPWHDLPDGERSPHILGYAADGSLINFYQMLLDELIEDGAFGDEDEDDEDFDNPAPMPLQLDEGELYQEQEQEQQQQEGDVIMLNTPSLLLDDEEETDYTEPPELYSEPGIDYEAVD